MVTPTQVKFLSAAKGRFLGQFFFPHFKSKAMVLNLACTSGSPGSFKKPGPIPRVLMNCSKCSLGTVYWDHPQVIKVENLIAQGQW